MRTTTWRFLPVTMLMVLVFLVAVGSAGPVAFGQGQATPKGRAAPGGDGDAGRGHGDVQPKAPEKAEQEQPKEDKPKEEKKDDSTTKPSDDEEEVPKNAALQFKLKDIKGTEIDMMQFSGRVLLIVPMAWDDRNRRQLEDLQRISSFAKDRGFVVIGVLTTDFQKEKENRSDAEVLKQFNDRFATTHLVCGTTVVTGENAHPMFKHLAAQKKEEGFKAGDIKAGFTKFLISRDGRVVNRFGPEERLIDRKYFNEFDKWLNTPITQ